MTQSEKRIAIAEACGWSMWHTFEEPKESFAAKPGQKYVQQRIPNIQPGTHPDCPFLGITKLPDYLNDLNAMHEAEQTVKRKYEYFLNLTSIVGSGNGQDFRVVHATASQRAEAFGLTLNLWKEGD